MLTAKIGWLAQGRDRGVRFSSEDYREASHERFAEANKAHSAGEYAAAHYLAGVAVECMLRAYSVRRDPHFDSRHDLHRLARYGGFYDAMPKKRQPEMAEILNELAIVWRNNHRYCSKRKLRGHLASHPEYKRARDVLKANSERVLGICDKVIKYGEMKWKKP